MVRFERCRDSSSARKSTPALPRASFRVAISLVSRLLAAGAAAVAGAVAGVTVVVVAAVTGAGVEDVATAGVVATVNVARCDAATLVAAECCCC